MLEEARAALAGEAAEEATERRQWASLRGVLAGALPRPGEELEEGEKARVAKAMVTGITNLQREVAGWVTEWEAVAKEEVQRRRAADVAAEWGKGWFGAWRMGYLRRHGRIEEWGRRREEEEVCTAATAVRAEEGSSREGGRTGMDEGSQGAERREGGGQGGGLRCAGARAAAGDGLGAQEEEPEDLEAVWEHLQREQGEEAFQAELEMEMEMEWEAERAGRGAAGETEREAGARERDGSRAEQLAAAAAAVRRAEEVVAAAQRVVRSAEEQRSGSGRHTERDLKQERQRRRREEAEAARQQSDRVAAQEQEIWTAKVRAVLASMTWKSGRRRKRSAARAVVGAERVGGGEAAAARAPSTKRGRTPEPDAKQGQFDPGGKTQRTQYGRSYPALDLSPVRREGSTGPERPQRRRPDGQECYVESRLAGAKRRRTGKGEETGMPTGRPPGE